MTKLVVIIAIFFLSCCQANHYEITKKTIELGRKQNLEEKIYQTKNFKIFTLQKITNQSEPIRIYLEGDGKAFINKYTISQNPTPTSYFLINLIAQDDSPNIIYIARPCQFIDDKKCEEKYWTNARFSKEIIDSLNEVLANFSKNKIELIGYSGGGAIALYLADRNNNILNLRTIAGNLDHEKFSEIHEVSKLDLSLQNKDLNFSKLAKIPQIHFIGSEDKIIPRVIVESYLKKLPIKNCARIIDVNKANHWSGWDEKWSEIIKIKLY